MRDRNQVVRVRGQAYLKQHGRFTISVITVLEVAKGLRKAQRDEALDRFIQGLGGLDIVLLGQEEALIGGRIYGDLERLGQPIGRADPMIAGIAISHGLGLATGNDDHYERVRGVGYELRTDNWRNAPGASGT